MKEILLNKGKVALVDDADFAFISEFRWRAWENKYRNIWYAITTVDGKTLSMHRAILGLGFGNRTEGDHEDGNGLNNQRSNLRTCSSRQNCMNRKAKTGKIYSRFKGVELRVDANRRRPWSAKLIHKRLGHFYTEEAAALAYNEAAKLNFGQFAKLNIFQ